ncbi:MAG: ice-binding family protein [Oxalobacteraceae bacterium]
MKIQQRYAKPLMWFSALIMTALVAGCGGGGGEGRDPILGAGGIGAAVPIVTLTVPADGATGVATNTKITATFNKEMSPATITGTTFTLAGPGVTAVPGLVSYDTGAKTATFTPTTSTDELLANTKYTATITTGAKDTAGTALARNFVWVFTTLANTGSPTVTAVNPVDPASTACLQKVINATFSRPMDPATINLPLRTFTIKTAGGIDVPGAVAYDIATRVATFKATADLSSGAYTATITTAAKDLEGVALAADKVWTFNATGLPCATPPAGQNLLGTVSRFGIFGGSAGMTNKGIQTVIKGSGGNTADIGTIATDTSAVTGFRDSAFDVYTVVPGVNEGIVTGKIYTCTTSVTGPTNPTNGVNAASCSNATQARLDAEKAYLALAALPAGPIAAPANLAGQTLAPGVYKASSGSFMIEGGNLTLDAQGDANAVWVFQMATTLTVGGPGAAAPQSVILTNGALAKNVFWQVGSAAIINAAGGGTMAGTIISQAGAAFSTAGNVAPVTLNGRALSLGASVTLVNTVINVPAP